MRVAVVGVGSMGQLHARLLAERRDVELLLADEDEARARGLSAELGAASTTADDALERAEAVVIATPPEWHSALVERAVARGLPALCEKPLAFDLEESVELTERIERANGTVQVGFQRRFDAGFAAARRLVEDGALGRVHLLRLAAHDPRRPAPPVQPDRALDCAPLFRDSSIHDFDLVRWLTGDEVVEVHAEGTARDGTRPDPPALLETAIVTMRLAAGALAVLDATVLDPAGYDIRAELIGERESATAGLSSRSPLRSLDADAPARGTAWSGYLERFEDAYRAELDAFLRVAAGELRPPVTARDATEAMRIAVAATRSFSERRRVQLDEIAAPRMAAAGVA